MATTLKTAAESYLRAKSLSQLTRTSTPRRSGNGIGGGGGIPIEQLRRKDIREFLDWGFDRAVKDEGENPGRTANKAREHLRPRKGLGAGVDRHAAPLPRAPGRSATSPAATT